MATKGVSWTHYPHYSVGTVVTMADGDTTDVIKSIGIKRVTFTSTTAATGTLTPQSCDSDGSNASSIVETGSVKAAGQLVNGFIGADAVPAYFRLAAATAASSAVSIYLWRE